MKQRIHVSQEDIDTTTQGAPEACMVWKAVTRSLQLETETGASPVRVSVGYDKIVFMGKRGQVEVKNTRRTREKINDFDSDKSLVEPFGFDLNLPDDWREQVQGISE